MPDSPDAADTVAIASVHGLGPWLVGAALLGVGTAMVYPTLLAAIGALTAASGLLVAIRMPETLPGRDVSSREATTMVSCCQCEGIERQFGPRTARWDLRRFRKRGPNPTTQALVDALRREGVAAASILDVGGGIGAIHHELLASGARHAVHVDISPDYLSVARQEAERRGHADNVEFVHGDFVEVASSLHDADLVTLDRVICCYPDMERLVALSAAKARRLVGAVYPRDRWWVRFAFAAANLVCRIRRTAFRVYVHPPPAIDGVLRAHGLERRSLRCTLLWEVVVYAR